MKTYDKYKDSGIEWIGDIPEHWEVERLATFGRFSKGKGISRSELTEIGLPAILYGDIYTKYEIKANKLTNRISEQTSRKSIEICKGTLLFTGSGETREDIGKCVVYVGDESAYAGGDVIIFRQSNQDSLFLSYSLNSNICVFQKTRDAKGEIIVHIYASKLRDVFLPIPTLPEQTAIADYLDEKTEQIDKLIANKGLLIELLKEERTAIINQAVTKGINPNAKLKPSGIDWLGDIPEHWEVKRLKFLSDITTGGRNTEDRIEDGEYPFFVRSQTIERIDTYCFDGEAILTAGDGVGVAKVFHYYNGKLECHQRVYLLSNFREVQGKFLFHYIKSNLYKEVFKLNAKSTVDSLRFPMFQNFVVSFPKDEIEQNEIIEHIESKTNEIDSTISKIKKEIELIKEYRTALVSEVVTGKIKVV